MKKLKFLFLIAIPVFLLSCGETNTRKGVNDEGGMGGRDRDYNMQDMQKDVDNNRVNQGVQKDTSMYRGTQQQRANDQMMGTPDPSQRGTTQQGVRTDTGKLKMHQDSSKKVRSVIK